MSEEHRQFTTRLRRLEKKQNAMNRYGYSTLIRPDGTLVVRPKKRLESRITGRSVFLFLAAFMLFKGFLIASIGGIGYDERVAKLSAGSVLEQGGALIMFADPLSLMIAGKIGPILR